MKTQRLQLELLAVAGRLLVEHNESTAEVHRVLKATASSLTQDKCEIAVSYGSLSVSLGPDDTQRTSVGELRFNMAAQAGIHEILALVRRGELEPGDALARLINIDAETPRHARWLVVALLGMAAASLAILLGADVNAALVAGVATAAGLLARQELARRRLALLTLPFVAAVIGAVLGGVAIRAGWTRTPGLALIVPSLILVPGPHFINGLLDLLDNFLPMSISRLFLAMSIVTAAALGTVVGVALVLGEFPRPAEGIGGVYLNLLLDMLLAGVVACGFAAAYNTMWVHLAMAVAGGMVGHGLRYVALENNWHLDAATFLGAFGVGLVSACIARSTKTPVAVIAYAGAVTMMPGLSIYRALGGARRLAKAGNADDGPLVAQTLGYAFEACAVVGALALGLVVAVQLVQILARVREDRASAGRRA